MTRLMIAAPLLVALAAPAFAGQPEMPGRKGVIVSDSRDRQIKEHPGGWGKHVASKAGPDGSLGQHLKTTDEGPDATADSGSGND